jgi:tRNA pseudouridine55 synthase
MDGILNFNKPQGMSSHGAVNFLRRLTGEKRVGHTGTLDPMASGVLPICIGKATRVIEYMEDLELANPGCAKAYECTMKLGLVTDTLDIWGTVLWGDLEKPPPKMPSRPRIAEAIAAFQGAQNQIPPAFSAIKYKGRKLYEYARAGKPIPEEALKGRDIYINGISLLGIDDARGQVSFSVQCSRGTYVRSLCHDIGALLGCGAAMSALTRTKSAGFLIETSVDRARLETLSADGGALPLLQIDAALGHLPALSLGFNEVLRFMNGLSVDEPLDGEKPQIDDILPHSMDGAPAAALPIRIYSGGIFVGIAQKTDSGRIKPLKVIAEKTHFDLCRERINSNMAGKA